jgi:hypothetical protein
MAFVPVVPGNQIKALDLNQVITALMGTAGDGQIVALTQLNDSTNYALTVQNLDPTNQRALNVLNQAGTSLLRVDVNGVTLGSPLNLPTGFITTTQIADGAVNSAKILDGTIASVDLALASTSFVVISPLVTDFSTTSSSYVDVTSATVSVTTVTGSQGVLLIYTGPAVMTAGTGLLTFTADGVAGGQLANITNTQGAEPSMVAYFISGPSAGSHQYKLQARAVGGTLTMGFGSVANGQLIALEIRR